MLTVGVAAFDGALTKENYVNAMKEAGFKDVKVLNEQLVLGLR